MRYGSPIQHFHHAATATNIQGNYSYNSYSCCFEEKRIWMELQELYLLPLRAGPPVQHVRRTEGGLPEGDARFRLGQARGTRRGGELRRALGQPGSPSVKNSSSCSNSGSNISNNDIGTPRQRKHQQR